MSDSTTYVTVFTMDGNTAMSCHLSPKVKSNQMESKRIARRWTGKKILIRSVLSEDKLKYLVVTVQDKEPAQIH